MQQLLFESSWDKTISMKDRKIIHETFLKTKTGDHNIHFVPLWQALNHKENLLVTVLIHNFSDELLSFNHTTIKYFEDRKQMAKYVFHLPALVVEAETSMPWTFIFPKETISENAKLDDGYLGMSVDLNQS
ncbi:SLAP domain-containing protein [Terrilactibacillus laevilacticus]|uniref:SLAP domain-containing protein n=1 Tax=Terrilactibacillus laevilacticus TaxID=1380157 RepID=A0ABW5PUT9_9BACI|nr:SLAP domain-containing protein [Terrilactibacillus laevilacticus]